MEKFLIFLVLLLDIQLRAQIFLPFENLTRQDGLTDNFITGISEDSEGYIWLSTQNGVNRYDGYNFKKYLRENFPGKSLIRNDLTNVFTDYNKNLWFAGDNGSILQYSQEVDSFINYSLSHLIINDYPQIHGFYQKDSSEMFALSSKGIFIKTKNSHGFVRPKWQIYNIYNKDISAFYIDKNNNIWFSTNSAKIYCITADIVTSSEYLLPGKSKNQSVQSILPIADTMLLLGTSSGIYQIGTSADTKIERILPELSNFHIKSMIKDKENNIWVGTVANGLWKINKYLHVEKIENRCKSKEDLINISTIFCDSYNRIWIGTNGNGVFVYNPNKNKIDILSTTNGLRHQVVKAVVTDRKNDLWVGTDGGGISVFDENLRLLHEFNTNNRFPSDFITDLNATNNEIWICNWYGGLIKYNIETHTYKTFTPENSSLTTNLINTICIYSQDSVLIGTQGAGINLYEEHNSQIETNLQFSGPRYFSEQQAFINQIIKDKDDKIWVITNRNLFTVKNNKIIDVIENNSVRSPHLPLRFYSIAYDNAAFLIAGTNYGIYRINTESKKYENITHWIPELKNSKILSVYVSSNGDYWFASTKGLYKCNPINKKYKKIVVTDRYKGLLFTPRAVYEDVQGKMYFGTNGGLISFYPDQLKWNNTIIRLSLADLSLSYTPIRPGGELLPKQLKFLDTIEIPSDINHWSISFNTICFDTPEAIEYAYKLDGFDKTWNYIGNKQEIIFSNIPYGKYILHVKAWQYDTNNYTEQTLAIRILPAWWETIPFKIMTVLFFILLLSLLYYIRMVSFKKQKTRLEKIVTEKTDELNIQNKRVEKQNTVLKQFSAKLEKSNNLLLNRKAELEYLTSELKEESSELAELNATLQKVNNTKEQLFSIITHDVRNSFLSIQDMTFSLNSELPDDKYHGVNRYIEKINKAVTNTSDVLNNLLYWSKTQTTAIECNPEYCNVDDLVTNVLESYSHVASEKRISVNYTNTDAHDIFADKEMIIIILRNIYNNALKYTPKGGFIIISARQKDDFVEIQIRDSGKGADKTTIDRLFSADMQKHNDSDISFKGSGLGLVVSQKFIEKNNGTIRAQSYNEKGTMFSISIPRKPVNIKVPHKQMSIINKDTPTIAIVEDNQAILKLISVFFEDEYNTLLFTNGQELLEHLKKTTVDIIISDILMPGIDGLTLCREIKNNINYRHIPIILISSRNDDLTKEQAYKYEAEAFFEKPLSKPVIIACVKRLLSKNSNTSAGLKSYVTSKKQTTNNILERFEEILKNNLANPEYTVDEMAKDLNLSRSQLFRKVKEQYAISPKDYFIKIRMQAAAELLQFPEIKIVDVAFSTGFSDPSYFSRSFIKHYGVSPSEYRNSLLNK